MIKIKRGEHSIDVSRDTYNKMFKDLGYEIVKEKKTEVKKIESKKIESKKTEVKESETKE